MLISLNWLKDFVEVPSGIDPRELALRFTTTTAEVDGIEHHAPTFSGLVAARIESLRSQPSEGKLQNVVVDSGGKKLPSLTSAPDIKVGDIVVYAPPGATVMGQPVKTTDPSGRPTEGMIVAWGALGFPSIGAHAVFLPPASQPRAAVPLKHTAEQPRAAVPHDPTLTLPLSRGGYKPGEPIDPAHFDDWVIEIDNKSITHRPDCWGHYGIAREIAAMLDLPLKPYDVTDPAKLKNNLSAIPIEIDNAAKCPRYTGLLMKGLRHQPAPLWMQVRLAMCGQRPIDLIVDLTNYIMLELGQPMHAFDGAKLRNIQVATAKPGEKFTTLDGVTRTMPPGTLMIQCDRKSVAIAGIMGGAATEVGPATDTVLLESANFDAATIRRAATAMGHRTEASARFEKSLDPAHTVLGIARFHKLAAAELPGLQLAGTLSDCYPAPKKIESIELDCDYAARMIGKDVSAEEMRRILERLEFKCEPIEAGTPTKNRCHTPSLKPPAPSLKPLLRVTPPSFRATKDIEIEADLIEEIARFVGYNNIEPTLPLVAARFFEPMPELALEQRTLAHLCEAGEFVEVHGYIWYDDDWNRKLGIESGECITLRNPAAENCAKLQRALAPGLIAVAERNRHHFDRFQIAEIGTVFFPGHKEVEKSQERHLGLLAAQAGKKIDTTVWDRLRTALDGWGLNVLNESPLLKAAKALHPWEDADRLAEIIVAGRGIGRITILPLALKQRIDERLAAWSIALAEVNLAAVVDRLDRHDKLPPVPRFPQVRLDFSTLADAARRYEAISAELARFSHPALRRLSFVEAYQGGSIPVGKRSLLFRAEIGLEDRTLTEEDIREFQAGFKGYLARCGLELRA
jgi:phenylalanyl-tRNA synthetase beta chain